MIEPVKIDPHALYDDGTLASTLGLTPSALATGRRSGSLRYTRRGKRIFYKGEWVSAWLGTDAFIGQPVQQGDAR